MENDIPNYQIEHLEDNKTKDKQQKQTTKKQTNKQKTLQMCKGGVCKIKQQLT